MDANSPPTPRPLRADAERNRRLILDAAKRAFAEHGLGVRLDEIAEMAGVGVGTVYRRFKDKDALVEALFEEQVGVVVALADEALETCDDGGGLRFFFERALDLMAVDRGLQQILTGPNASAERLSAMARTAIAPRVGELLRRSHAAGTIRADIVDGDLPVIQVILSAIVDATSQVRPDLYRRYGELLLAAFEPRAGDAALPAPPPTAEEGISIVEGWIPRPRRAGARG